MRVLIADDEPGVVALLLALMPGVELRETASDGEQAVRKVSAALENGEAYDVVFLDIGMPKKDGHAALREIRAIEAEHGVDLGDGAKVIMVTGAGDSENVFDAFHREGCDGYIVKPFNEDSLRETFAKVGLEVG